jgi:hypothetical protein
MIATALAVWRVVTRYPWLVAGVLLGALLVGYIAVVRHERDAAQAAVVQTGLRLENVRAAADTTRRELLELKDSARAWSRGAIQTTAAPPDAVDRALRVQSASIAQLAASVAQLAAHVASTAPVTEDASGARAASFTVDSTPYHAHADVVLPRSGPGQLALRVTLDTAQLALRNTCALDADPVTHVRAARTLVTGPPWLAIAITHAEQSAEVCNASALSRGTTATVRPWWRPTLTLGAGAVYTNGRLVAGPAVVAGFPIF